MITTNMTKRLKDNRLHPSANPMAERACTLIRRPSQAAGPRPAPGASLCQLHGGACLSEVAGQLKAWVVTKSCCQISQSCCHSWELSSHD